MLQGDAGDRGPDGIPGQPVSITNFILHLRFKHSCQMTQRFKQLTILGF